MTNTDEINLNRGSIELRLAMGDAPAKSRDKLRQSEFAHVSKIRISLTNTLSRILYHAKMQGTMRMHDVLILGK